MDMVDEWYCSGLAVQKSEDFLFLTHRRDYLCTEQTPSTRQLNPFSTSSHAPKLKDWTLVAIGRQIRYYYYFFSDTTVLNHLACISPPWPQFTSARRPQVSRIKAPREVAAAKYFPIPYAPKSSRGLIARAGHVVTLSIWAGDALESGRSKAFGH